MWQQAYHAPPPPGHADCRSSSRHPGPRWTCGWAPGIYQMCPVLPVVSPGGFLLCLTATEAEKKGKSHRFNFSKVTFILYPGFSLICLSTNVRGSKNRYCATGWIIMNRQNIHSLSLWSLFLKEGFLCVEWHTRPCRVVRTWVEGETKRKWKMSERVSWCTS